MVSDDGYQPLLGPEQVEAEINTVRQRIAKSVRPVAQAREKARTSRRAYQRAYAHAYLAADGPQQEKRYRAEIDPGVIARCDEADVDEEAFKYAVELADSLREDLSALQAVNKSMIAMFGATTGVGR